MDSKRMEVEKADPNFGKNDVSNPIPPLNPVLSPGQLAATGLQALGDKDYAGTRRVLEEIVENYD